MKLKENITKILVPFLVILYFIGLFIGNTFNIIVLSIIGNIAIVLALCVPLFEIRKIRIPVIIFVGTFLLEEAIGYGFNIRFLKYYVSTGINDHYGMEISIVSIVFPVVIALIISFAYKILKRKTA